MVTQLLEDIDLRFEEASRGPDREGIIGLGLQLFDHTSAVIIPL